LEQWRGLAGSVVICTLQNFGIARLRVTAKKNAGINRDAGAIVIPPDKDQYRANTHTPDHRSKHVEARRQSSDYTPQKWAANWNENGLKRTKRVSIF
jgi:hypothetical protein